MALTEREPRASRGLPAASLRNTVADTEAVADAVPPIFAALLIHHVSY